MNYAQFGEDAYVERLFLPGFVGTAVDIGATGGVIRNNTYMFELVGWRVLCVEANPLYESELRKNRKEVAMVACADYEADNVDFIFFTSNWEAGSALKPAWGTLTKWGVREDNFRTIPTNVRKLNTLLEEAGIEHVDYVSIDVEGGEIDVLNGFDVLKYNPAVLAIESWDEDNPVVEYMKNIGYKRVKRCYVNDLFVKENHELPSDWGTSLYSV
jgi:FkbM family methyltransferase